MLRSITTEIFDYEPTSHGASWKWKHCVYSSIYRTSYLLIVYFTTDLEWYNITAKTLTEKKGFTVGVEWIKKTIPWRSLSSLDSLFCCSFSFYVWSWFIKKSSAKHYHIRRNWSLQYIEWQQKSHYVDPESIVFHVELNCESTHITDLWSQHSRLSLMPSLTHLNCFFQLECRKKPKTFSKHQINQECISISLVALTSKLTLWKIIILQ